MQSRMFRPMTAAKMLVGLVAFAVGTGVVLDLLTGGEYLLYFACCHGITPLARAALWCGADPNSNAYDGFIGGRRPLHFVIRSGSAGTCRALVEAGADVLEVAGQENARQQALRAGHPEIIALFTALVPAESTRSLQHN